MKGERILSRQFDKINRLKKELVYRSTAETKEVIEDLKEATDDLEAILLDLGYLDEKKVSCEERHVRTYRCFRDIVEYSAEELEKYNGKDGMPLYIAVGDKVYDFSELLNNREDESLEELINSIINNEELLSNYTIVGKIK